MQIGIDYTSAARQRAGIGRYTRELVSALLALDDRHDYTIFAATGALPEARWLAEVERLRTIHSRQLAIRTVPISDDWMARLWHRLRLPVPIELITGHLDAFYSPDFTLPPTRRGTRTLLTVHDLSFLRHPDTFVPTLRRYLAHVVPRSIEHADIVLADSVHTRSDLVSLLAVPGEKVEVIYPGVDARFRPDSATATDRAQHSHNALADDLRSCYDVDDTPYVLSVGTLQPRKNYVRLIEAFGRTRRRLRGDLQLLIAGSRGWLCEDVFSEADRHEHVRLLGFVEDEHLPDLYRGAALFALPSLYEGFGLPALEAMACGTPVVCSNTSSLPEVTGDAALLVDPWDVEALGVAMERALTDPELRRGMIDRGLQRASRFAWPRAARQLSSVITSWEER